MGLRACTHPDMHGSRERECVCVWAHRYVNARAYTRVRAEMHTPLSRVRERFRAYGRGGRIVSPSLCFSLSLSPLFLIAEIYERGRVNPIWRASSSQKRYFLADSIDTPLTADFILPIYIIIYRGKSKNPKWFLFGKFCSIKILYIWFCIIRFFFAILLRREVVEKIF